MSEIHRKQIALGEPFNAPENVTFGFQPARETFSIWYISGSPETSQYIVLGTGHEYPNIKSIVSTVCCDGFHVFHLCKL